MNREILFRGISVYKENGLQVFKYGNLIYSHNTTFIVDKNGVRHEVLAHTIGQYIGIHCGCYKIFEGDILYNQMKCVYDSVEYSTKGMPYFTLKNKDWSVVDNEITEWSHTYENIHTLKGKRLLRDSN